MRNRVYERHLRSAFLKKLKKANVRTRKSVKERVLLFSKEPNNPQLHNHALRGEYFGYWSIDITSDWRAVYTYVGDREETTAYFVALGTHKDLYRKSH